MFKIPEKINILGFDYKIIQHHSINNELILDGKLCAGLANQHIQEIHLNCSGKNEQYIYQTLIHEIIHCIEYRFDPQNEHTDLTEWQIDMIATGLASFILQNNECFNG